MSKYSHFQMCEKIFGSRYKFNEKKELVPYSRTDMWDKLLEQKEKIEELQDVLFITREDFNKKIDIIDELDNYFENIFDELNPNWKIEWRGGMKAYYNQAIKEIKELKSKKNI